ncbi:serine/threonine-protein kinase [Actinoalloteichus hymeniacidonis]|uniref:non-specific serine/threonine protein kinase n=1 Tax=Actinoalloteichus hymeniacidonis TaxID=340345 RepID=A0AAC9HU68_9PSEU|nr:serine/threonine-protein kinase [Actinoalloteichus hymeniacidonis]AOS64580.1 protein kinase family protein [Actinoalloteichus hymeniacidonis]MBB5907348.1 serine/threonine-protein kinase [Actinoalloteichus hymeniacidonis]
MTLLNPGDRVSDTLVVDRLLGEGAFAEVHRVQHEFLGWQAMKLFKRVASSSETRAMLGEARLLSTLGHPNIVRLFEASTVVTPEGVRGFFTMEYVAGGSLERLATAHRPSVPTELAAEVMTQIATGLAVAHIQDPPIVHRDITMANILVGYDDAGLRVRVSDFGLAKRADPFTQLASAQGTYAFMAPEVLRGDGYSCAGDVWSVGTIGYLLLTDHLPFHDGEMYSSFSLARFNKRLLPPSSYNETVDRALDEIVMSALEVDPGNRPSTARVLEEALRARREHRVRRPPENVADGAAPTGRPVDERATELARQALALSRVPGELDRAADLMEEAVSLSSRTRDRYLPALLLWRRGVVV